MTNKILVAFVIVLHIFIFCNKAVTKGGLEEGTTVKEESSATQEEVETPDTFHEYGLEWTLSFNSSSVKLDSISVDDNPVIILPKSFLPDSITGRVDKIDNLFTKGFKNKIHVVKNNQKLVVPVKKNGMFSFKSSDILKPGNNEVYFDLAVKKGFFLTNVINVFFVVSDEKRE